MAPGYDKARFRYLFDYDYLGRRIQKWRQFTYDDGTTWTTEAKSLYIYDGWNLLYEAEVNEAQTTVYNWRSYGWLSLIHI